MRQLLREMQSEDPKLLAEKLIDAGVVAPGSLVGCSDGEIAALESYFSVQLPEAYKAFLRVWGKADGGYLNDCLYLYSSLIKWVRPSAESSAQLNNLQILPTWFFFLARDSVFLFFDTVQGNDPPVFRYTGGFEGFEQVYDSFSFWLTDMVNVDIESWKEFQQVKREIAQRDSK